MVPREGGGYSPHARGTDTRSRGVAADPRWKMGCGAVSDGCQIANGGCGKRCRPQAHMLSPPATRPHGL